MAFAVKKTKMYQRLLENNHALAKSIYAVRSTSKVKTEMQQSLSMSHGLPYISPSTTCAIVEYLDLICQSLSTEDPIEKERTDLRVLFYKNTAGMATACGKSDKLIEIEYPVLKDVKLGDFFDGKTFIIDRAEIFKLRVCLNQSKVLFTEYYPNEALIIYYASTPDGAASVFCIDFTQTLSELACLNEAIERRDGFLQGIKSRLESGMFCVPFSLAETECKQGVFTVCDRDTGERIVMLPEKFLLGWKYIKTVAYVKEPYTKILNKILIKTDMDISKVTGDNNGRLTGYQSMFVVPLSGVSNT